MLSMVSEHSHVKGDGLAGECLNEDLRGVQRSTKLSLHRDSRQLVTTDLIGLEA